MDNQNNPEENKAEETKWQSKVDPQKMQDVLETEHEQAVIDYEAELLKHKDQLLRALAETDNIRKREKKLREDERLYAITGFSRDMMEPIENLYRAMDNIPESAKISPEFKSFIDGMEITIKEFNNALTKNGMKRIFPNIGDMFDHNLHQAVAHVPDANAKEGSVISVMQAGYLIHDRLLRPAMVAVAKQVV